MTLGLASCTSTPITSRANLPAGPHQRFETVATPIQTIPATLVGLPQVTDGIVVSYVVESGDLALVAWDAVSGTVRWRTPAIPGSSVPPGVELSIHLVDVGGRTWAPHLEYVAPDADRVVAVDVRTGETVSATALIDAQDRPRECPGGGRICVIGVMGGTGESTDLVFDVATGAFIQPERGMVPSGTFGYGGGLYSTDIRGCTSPPGEWLCDTLGFAVGGKSVWERPWRDIFGADSCMAWGWIPFVLDDADVIAFGAYSLRYEYENGEVVRRIQDFGADRVVGLSKATGETVWQYDGGRIRTTDATAQELVLTDVGAGRLVVEDVGDHVTYTISDMAGLRTIRIRLSDGVVLWEAPADPASIFQLEDDPAFADLPAASLVRTGDGLTLVDLESGATHASPRDGTYPCSSPSRVDLPYSPYPELDNSGHYDFNGEYTVWPCRSDGKTPADHWSTDAVDLVGVHDPGDPSLVVVPTDGALLVFRLA